MINKCDGLAHDMTPLYRLLTIYICILMSGVPIWLSKYDVANLNKKVNYHSITQVRILLE